MTRPAAPCLDSPENTNQTVPGQAVMRKIEKRFCEASRLRDPVTSIIMLYITPVLSICPLHTNGGSGKEAHINCSMVICQDSTCLGLP